MGGCKIELRNASSFDESWRLLAHLDILIIYRRRSRTLAGDLSLTVENDFLPDLDAIPEDSSPKLNLSIFNYPNNPTGAVAAFYEKLVAWAKTYEVGVVSDLAYGALGYRGYENPASLSTPVAKMWALSSILSKNLQYG